MPRHQSKRPGVAPGTRHAGVPVLDPGLTIQRLRQYPADAVKYVNRLESGYDARHAETRRYRLIRFGADDGADMRRTEKRADGRFRIAH